MLDTLFDELKILETLMTYLPYISVLPVIIMGIHFLFKITNRTKIEKILDSKYQNKMYELFEIMFVSIIIPIAITIYAFSLNIELSQSTIEIIVVVSTFIILLGACLFIIVYVSHQVIPSCIKKHLHRLLNKYTFISKVYYRLSKKAVRINILKVAFIVYFISLSILNFVYLYIFKISQAFYPEVILTIIAFSIVYLITLYIFKYLFSKALNRKEVIEMSVIEHANEHLPSLSYQYAIDGKKFVFIEKQDAGKSDINSLNKYFVYYVEEKHLLMFNVYEKEESNV